MEQNVNAGDEIRKAIADFQQTHRGIRRFSVQILRKTLFGVSITIDTKVNVEKFTQDTWNNRDGVEICWPKEWKDYRFTKERPVTMADIVKITYRQQVVYKKPK